VIPIQLHLSGFLSYRNPVELSFEGFDLACISGQNGAGKSSLLDAITFALFGEARRRDDAIINNAADAAEVRLDFEYEDDVYRIQRTKQRGKSTLLEFFIQAEDGTWKPLTEATLRATEERIQSTLHMDFETFTNASFFLQGKADQFAQQRPGDRKRILSSILGLEIWESYREEAARRRKGRETDLAIIEDRIVEIENELKEEDDRKARLTEAEKEYSTQKTLADAKKQLLEQQRVANERFLTDQRQVEKQVAEVERQRRELEEQTSRLLERQTERKNLQDQLSREAEIKTAKEAWEKAKVDLESWEKLAANFQKFDKQRAAPLQAIAAEKARLETEIKNLRTAEGDVQRIHSGIAALKDQIAASEAQLDMTRIEAQKRDVFEADLRQITEQKANLNAENSRLKLEMNEIKSRLDQLKEVSGAACPVCGKPLSPEERKKMISELQASGKEMGDLYRKNDKTLSECGSRYKELEAKLESLKKVDEQIRQQQRALDGKILELNSSEKAIADWDATGKVKLRELMDEVNGEKYAPEAREKLATIDAELKDLGYDAAAHEKVRREEQAGRGSQEEWLKLEKARASLAPIEREIETMHDSIEKLQNRVNELADELATAQERLAKEKEKMPDLAALELENADLQTQVSDLAMRLAQAKNLVNVLEKLKQQKKDKKEEKESITVEISRLKTLERAFGKDGIPALLIEQALPEIESNANEILERLSDGNMSVKFETQREFKDKKRDDRKETLDIRIRDGAGEREYEMFSGGEAFRVNFAIRLALSRVLSRRAGARLRTLVIDEGFGSQDAEGRQRLIEAINMVQGDFAKILVITHMEELKDAFPARIEVSKTAGGSFVEVVTA
jgi:exonuclease SbcC